MTNASTVITNASTVMTNASTMMPSMMPTVTFPSFAHAFEGTNNAWTRPNRQKKKTGKKRTLKEPQDKGIWVIILDKLETCILSPSFVRVM